MSLIQEALKRKMEEKNAGGAASPPPPPPSVAAPASVAPPPIPAGPAQGVVAAAPGAPNVSRVIGVVGGLVVMVVVAVLLIAMALRSWSARKLVVAAEQVQAAAPAAAGLAPPAAAPGSPAGTVDPAAGRSTYGSVVDRVNDMKGKVAEHRTEASELTGAGAPAATPPVIESPKSAASTVLSAFGQEPEEPATGGTSLDSGGSFSLWPRLTINGILAKGNRGRGIAIINNQMMSVNEQMEGARLLEVRGTGVLMEFGGETRFIEIGQTIQ